jgi:hypothetical protein
MIQVGSYPTRSDAELAQTALAAAGIQSLVAADDAGGAYPFDLTGGARLLVDEADLRPAGLSGRPRTEKATLRSLRSSLSAGQPRVSSSPSFEHGPTQSRPHELGRQRSPVKRSRAAVVVDVSNSSFEDAEVHFFETSTGNCWTLKRASPTTLRCRSWEPELFQRLLRAVTRETDPGVDPYSIVHATQFFRFIKGIARCNGNTVRLAPV